MNNIKKKLKKIIKILVLCIYRIFILLHRTNRRIILFESNVGRNYSGNPRFIYEEMVRRGLDQFYHCYYILEDTSLSLPGKAKKIRRISLAYFYLFSKAGIWVSDTRMPSYLKKRKSVIYIQTWHGTPLKRLGLDLFQMSMEGESGLEHYKREFAKNAMTWDYLISQNTYSTGIFRRAFAFRQEVLEIGYPRNDILINENTSDKIAALKKRFRLPSDKKIILYAPTWRDNESYAPHQYRFSTDLDFSCLKEQLAKDYIILVKAHYLVSERIDFNSYQDFLFQFGAAYDIAELYLISDILITDYSSVMFDYSLLNRPMIFYAYDLDYYKDQLRGFYFDFIQEAPGPITKTTQELVQAILDYDDIRYQEKYQKFKEKYNHADHGDASGRVVDLMISYGGS